MSSIFDSLWLNDLPLQATKPAMQTPVKKAKIPALAYPKPWCDEAEFLRTVENHKLAVLADDGLYRHLRFSSGSFNRWFELVTWPGKLAISGDMGTYVFTRIEDMFAFFRGTRATGALEINPGYWAQKRVAHDRDGVQSFDGDYFKARIHEWLQDCSISKACWEEIQTEVLSRADDGEHFAMQSAIEFKSEDGFVFQDFREADCKVHTYHYLWCLYAIVWGIRQYDALKVERIEEGPK